MERKGQQQGPMETNHKSSKRKNKLQQLTVPDFRAQLLKCLFGCGPLFYQLCGIEGVRRKDEPFATLQNAKRQSSIPKCFYQQMEGHDREDYQR